MQLHDGHPAINVKIQRLDVPDEHQQYATKAYETVQEAFWHEATELAQQYGYSQVFAEGRSGGWLVPFFQEATEEARTDRGWQTHPETGATLFDLWPGQGPRWGYPRYADPDDEIEAFTFGAFEGGIESMLDHVPDMVRVEAARLASEDGPRFCVDYIVRDRDDKRHEIEHDIEAPDKGAALVWFLEDNGIELPACEAGEDGCDGHTFGYLADECEGLDNADELEEHGWTRDKPLADWAGYPLAKPSINIWDDGRLIEILDVREENTQECPTCQGSGRAVASAMRAVRVHPTPDTFVSLVANMLIDGDCMDHQHNRTDCLHPDTEERGCCTEECRGCVPVHQDGDVEALYELIATARQIKERGT